MTEETSTLSDNDKSLSSSEERFLDLAFKYAYEALSVKEVPVGCIFVYRDQVIAKGRNEVNITHNATRHAEMICINQVKQYCVDNELDVWETFRGISVYVTVEPCIMCTAALYDLAVKAVIFGCQNDRFGGQTVFDVQSGRKSSVRMMGGHRSEEALHLLKEFYKGSNPSAPLAKLKVKN